MSIYVEDMNTIYITGGGYVRKAFSGIGRNSIGYNEVVWSSTLTRSNTFSLENIDDVDFGIVPQCQIHFPFLKIEDFIILQSLLKERHVIVEYFDIDLGKRVVHEMAITKNERKKIYSQMNYVNGVYDFSVNFVGTNRDDDVLRKCSITYNANTGDGAIAGIDSIYSNQVKLSNGKGFHKDGYHLASWNTQANGNGASYLPNQSITLYDDLTLYAIWE